MIEPDPLDARELAAQPRHIETDRDHDRAARAARSVEKVIVVAADRAREPDFGAEEVDGRGLAVIAREDDRFAAFRGRKRRARARERSDERIPAEHIGEVLRNATLGMFFHFDAAEIQDALVAFEEVQR